MRRRFPRGGAALLIALAFGCGGGAGGATEPIPTTDFLVVQPGREAVLTGDTLHLRVTASDGAAVAATSLTWTSSAPHVVTVDATGTVTALDAGDAIITATDGEASGKTYLAVARGSGSRVPATAAFDSIIPAIMARWGIPGGAVAVVKDGRLLLARGYGWSDREAGEIVQPTSLFRIASISKPITSAAVLKLREEGRLDLDDPAFAALQDLEPPAGSTEDPRLAQITLRHLLHHAGGWDRDASFDPMFRSTVAADAVGATAPASAETVIRYMLGQPLQFDAGTAYSYSNFGYAVLGRYIERTTGRSYEDYVRTEILAPMGITEMRIGRTLPADRADGEVRYYDPATTQSVFPDGGTVAYPDGGFYLEAMDSHGGWIASAVDLLRFVTAVDGLATRPDLLDPSTIELMTARPPAPLWAGSSYHYAMGWQIRPAGSGANWWHTGSLPGTTTLLVRAHNGLAWAAVFNARAGTGEASVGLDLDQAMWRGVESVTSWPTHDLFAAYE